jgi:hypothetical protein
MFDLVFLSVRRELNRLISPKRMSVQFPQLNVPSWWNTMKINFQPSQINSEEALASDPVKGPGHPAPQANNHSSVRGVENSWF